MTILDLRRLFERYYRQPHYQLLSADDGAEVTFLCVINQDIISSSVTFEPNVFNLLDSSFEIVDGAIVSKSKHWNFVNRIYDNITWQYNLQISPAKIITDEIYYTVPAITADVLNSSSANFNVTLPLSVQLTYDLYNSSSAILNEPWEISTISINSDLTGSDSKYTTIVLPNATVDYVTDIKNSDSKYTSIIATKLVIDYTPDILLSNSAILDEPIKVTQPIFTTSLVDSQSDYFDCFVDFTTNFNIYGGIASPSRYTDIELTQQFCYDLDLTSSTSGYSNINIPVNIDYFSDSYFISSLGKWADLSAKLTVVWDCNLQSNADAYISHYAENQQSIEDTVCYRGYERLVYEFILGK